MSNTEIKRNVILNEEQISELFEFVRSKSVRYIDVSHEIVDHLASAIEELMNKNETLTFEQGLRQVYSGFPITGFYYFVEEKEKVMTKFWNRVIKDYALSYVQTPKIFTLIGLLVIIFGAVFLFGQPAAIAVFVFVFIVHLYYLYSNYKYFKNLTFDKKDYLITMSFNTKFNNIFFAPVMFFYVSDSSFFARINTNSPTHVVIFSLIMTIYLLWSYGCLNYFKVRLAQELSSSYSHLKVLNN